MQLQLSLYQPTVYLLKRIKKDEINFIQKFQIHRDFLQYKSKGIVVHTEKHKTTEGLRKIIEISL